MGVSDEMVLRAAKEIVVKFIETGRVSPTGFGKVFGNIYQEIHKCVEEPETKPADEAEGQKPDKKKN